MAAPTTVAEALVQVRANRPTVDSAKASRPYPSEGQNGQAQDIKHVVTAAEVTATLADILTNLKVASFSAQVTTSAGVVKTNALTITLRPDGQTVRVANGTTLLVAGDIITLHVKGI